MYIELRAKNVNIYNGNKNIKESLNNFNVPTGNILAETFSFTLTVNLVEDFATVSSFLSLECIPGKK